MGTPVPNVKKETKNNCDTKVQTSFLPDCFEWFGSRITKARFNSLDVISVNNSGFRISEKAAKEAGFTVQDTLEVGISKKYLAIRKNVNGIPVKCFNSYRGALLINASRLIKKHFSDLDLPLVLPCIVDEKSRMLVAELPQIPAKR